MASFIGFERQGNDGYIIVNAEQIKTISTSYANYARVTLIDGKELHSLNTVKDFAKLLGLKKKEDKSEKNTETKQ